MIFHIPKEIASENKLWKSIYIKDFAIIVIFLVFAWISSTISGIYAPFKIAFFIFMFSIAILLVQKNQRNNPNKRLYEAIYILFKKNNRTYHSIDYNIVGNNYENL